MSTSLSKSQMDKEMRRAMRAGDKGEEVWKVVDETNGLYEVSNHGRFKGLQRSGRGLLIPQQQDGYMKVTTNVNGKRRDIRLHKLVAEAFVPNPHNLPEILWIDENSCNNNASNLKWVTTAEKRANAAGKKPGKPVEQINMATGRIIAEFPSVKAAHEKTGVNASSIASVCNGGRGTQAGGFKWQYKNKKTEVSEEEQEPGCKPIPEGEYGILDQYEISEKGTIYNIADFCVIPHRKTTDGYPVVSLKTNNGVRSFQVHRLLAIAHIPNPGNYDMVKIINKDKDILDLNNLQWRAVSIAHIVVKHEKELAQFRMYQQRLPVALFKKTRKGRVFVTMYENIKVAGISHKLKLSKKMTDANRNGCNYIEIDDDFILVR